MDGMCPRHNPEVESMGEEEEEEGVGGGNEDDFEAVRATQRTRLEHKRYVDGTPTTRSSTAEPQPLPTRLAAALATIIGATIQSILSGAEGSAIGADVGQWRSSNSHTSSERRAPRYQNNSKGVTWEAVNFASP